MWIIFYNNLLKCVYFVVASYEVSFKLQTVIGSFFHVEGPVCFYIVFILV